MQPTTPAPRFAFGPRNYRLMWAGLAVLAVGFITMMLDGAQYGEGFLGLTLGPILLVIGFIIEFVAIMARSNPSQEVPVAPAHPGVAAPVAAPTAAAPVVPAPAPTKPAYKRL
jgi:membrane-bound ClpP family serine protease